MIVSIDMSAKLTMGLVVDEIIKHVPRTQGEVLPDSSSSGETFPIDEDQVEEILIYSEDRRTRIDFRQTENHVASYCDLVHLEGQDKDFRRYFGTGTLIKHGGRQFVLTCAHCVVRV